MDFELSLLTLRSRHHRCCIQVKDVFHKFIEVLGFNPIGRQQRFRKIPLIEIHNNTGTTSNGCAKNMTIICIQQCEARNKCLEAELDRLLEQARAGLEY